MEIQVFSLFSGSLKREIEVLGWEKPTDIQVMAIPKILQGENVLLIAPTGTGKTEAAVFPVFEQFLRKRSGTPLQGISILYITPLRALNRDIFRRLIEVGDSLDIKVQVRHGDTQQRVRRKQAITPPDMLITTPETFQAIMPGKRMSKHLASVKWVIVDEVHELAINKRGVQLSVGLERLEKITEYDFQRIGLSATIGSPELIASFLCGNGRKFQILKTIESKDFHIWVESPTAGSEDRQIAKEVLLSPGSVKRIQRLFELIDDYRSSLIFTNTREHAEALSSRMIALRPQMRVGVHHGSLSRDVRVETEKKLKDGFLKTVICTSSLELGIDIGNIEFIVQYLSPKQVTRIVQRVGRSGHVIGGKARGCIIAAWPDDILESAIISKFALEGVLEFPKIHEQALDVLAHQVAGLTLQWGRIELKEVLRLVSKAWPYREINVEDVISVVNQLEESKIIWFDGKVLRRRYPHIFRYYYQNLSTIPDVKRYNVLDFLRKRRIGTLDQEFIAKNGEVGQEFIMHGQTWRLINVDDEETIVRVESVQQSFGAIPSWEGEVIPVSFPVAQEVGRIRGELAQAIIENRDPSKIFDEFPLNKEAYTKIIDVMRNQLKKGYSVPTNRRILIEGFESYVVIHGCFGNLVNETLGKALAALLSSRLGVNVGTQVDAYRIALITPSYLRSEVVKEELIGILPNELDLIFSETLGYTNLFAWRLWNVAKRFGIVGKDAEYKSSRGRKLASVLRNTPVFQETLREIYVEKMDLENTKIVLQRIRDNEIKVEVKHNGIEYSPLALPILDRIAPHDILRPAIPTQPVIEIVKERLERGKVRLICIFNGDYNSVRNLRTLPDKIKCSKCDSTLIAATYPHDTKLIKIVKKKITKQRLTKEEEKEWRKSWQSASLVQTYGKKALIALVARGIGPNNAVRILRNYHRTEDDFYRDIIRLEREYARTRMFWDH